MKKTLKHLALWLMLAAVLTCTVACNQGDTPATDTSTDSQEESISETTPTEGAENGTEGEGEDATSPATDESDPATTPSEEETDGEPTVTPLPSEITLTFDGTKCSVAVQGILTTKDGAFIISQGGTYVLSGHLEGGQLRFAVPKTDDVTIVLNGFTATCSTSAPLYIESCNKVTLELAADTVNTLTDAATYRFDGATDKPNACIYASDDMTIKGEGTLNVNANYNNGIGCKNDLRIKSGTINVRAVNNILKGNDSVTIEGGTLTLSGGEDAIKADAIDRADKGFILITGNAHITVDCTDDALQATNSITVEAGASVTGAAGGDVTNCDSGHVTLAEGCVTVK